MKPNHIIITSPETAAALSRHSELAARELVVLNIFRAVASGSISTAQAEQAADGIAAHWEELERAG